MEVDKFLKTFQVLLRIFPPTSFVLGYLNKRMKETCIYIRTSSHNSVKILIPYRFKTDKPNVDKKWKLINFPKAFKFFFNDLPNRIIPPTSFVWRYLNKRMKGTYIYIRTRSHNSVKVLIPCRFKTDKPKMDKKWKLINFSKAFRFFFNDLPGRIIPPTSFLRVCLKKRI